MALYPSFNPVKREEVPNYVAAEIHRAQIENQAKAANTAERNKMLSSIPSAAKGGLEAYQSFDVKGADGNVTGNKVGDWVKGKMGGGSDPRAEALRGGTNVSSTPPPPSGAGAQPFAGPSAAPISNTAGPGAFTLGGTPGAATGGVEGAMSALGATPSSAMPGLAGMTGGSAAAPGISTASTMAPEAMAGMMGLGEGAGAAAALEGSMLAGGAGSAAGTAAAGTGALTAGTAGAGAAGAGAAGGLSAAAGPLAAMGPYGWAALAALAIGSQFM